jgi:hypothetical protein
MTAEFKENRPGGSHLADPERREGHSQTEEYGCGQIMELARGLEPLTYCFSAASIGGLWPGGIVWRLA